VPRYFVNVRFTILDIGQNGVPIRYKNNIVLLGGRVESIWIRLFDVDVLLFFWCLFCQQGTNGFSDTLSTFQAGVFVPLLIKAGVFLGKGSEIDPRLLNGSRPNLTPSITTTLEFTTDLWEMTNYIKHD